MFTGGDCFIGKYLELPSQMFKCIWLKKIEGVGGRDIFYIWKNDLSLIDFDQVCTLWYSGIFSQVKNGVI